MSLSRSCASYSRTFFLINSMLFLTLVSACHSAEIRLDEIKLPPGFAIELFARNLPGARSMALGSKGTLFVGTRGEGKVYAVQHGGSPQAKVITVVTGLNEPNGVAYREGALYVAEISRVIRFDDIENSLSNPPKPVQVNASFPGEKHHGWKFIRFGPDGRLYVPVGAPCNVCDSKDQRFASIMRMAPGKDPEIFARGVRNTVGFDWHPATRELWFTDNGRDRLGDDQPPDELNRAVKAGQHFGFPYWHGRDIPDPKYGGKMSKADFVPPEIELPAHVAALGMRFYTGAMFPAEYRNQIFIAEHGSWNRSVPTGYRISLIRFRENKAASYQIFAQGWLSDADAWGRPVDLQVMLDGSLLVSDDKAGAIYRISYRK